MYLMAAPNAASSFPACGKSGILLSSLKDTNDYWGRGRLGARLESLTIWGYVTQIGGGGGGGGRLGARLESLTIWGYMRQKKEEGMEASRGRGKAGKKERGEGGRQSGEMEGSKGCSRGRGGVIVSPVLLWS